MFALHVRSLQGSIYVQETLPRIDYGFGVSNIPPHPGITHKKLILQHNALDIIQKCPIRLSQTVNPLLCFSFTKSPPRHTKRLNSTSQWYKGASLLALVTDFVRTLVLTGPPSAAFDRRSSCWNLFRRTVATSW